MPLKTRLLQPTSMKANGHALWHSQASNWFSIKRAGIVHYKVGAVLIGSTQEGAQKSIIAWISTRAWVGNKDRIATNPPSGIQKLCCHSLLLHIPLRNANE